MALPSVVALSAGNNVGGKKSTLINNFYLEVKEMIRGILFKMYSQLINRIKAVQTALVRGFALNTFIFTA